MGFGTAGAAAAAENTESDYTHACTRPRNPTQHFVLVKSEGAGDIEVIRARANGENIEWDV